MFQKNSFLFKNDITKEIDLDGPTMIYLCFIAVDPDTVVGLDAIEDKLKSTKLGDFGNNVSKMLTDMETNYKILKEKGQAPSKYRKILLDALLTGPNHTFNQFFQHMIDDTESGIGSMANIFPDEVITACCARYNNMETKKLWNKVDPHDAQLMAIATELKELKSQQTKATALVSVSNTDLPKNPPKGNGRRTDDKFINGVARWRTVKDGDTKVVDDRTYYWCPHHNHPKG